MKRIVHSVVLANYNGAAHLQEAVDSVLRQDHDGMEIILVDDASTDGSARIMHDFRERHPTIIKVFEHPVNRGQGAGFNTGVANAQGTYVSFIDSDDAWFPGKLSHVDQAFARFPEAALHHHNLYTLRNGEVTEELVVDSMALGHVGRWWKKRKVHPAMLSRFSPTAGLSMPRDVLVRLMPCPEVRICADMWLTFGALAFGPVSASYDAHGAYRVHDGNNYHGQAIDIWSLLRDDLLPVMRERWAEQGLEDVAPDFATAGSERGRIDRLLDLSPRSAWRWMARAWKAVDRKHG